MCKEVKVLELPQCQMCEASVASYDSRLFAQTIWAFLCEKCYEKFGVSLGTGNAQKLILTKKEN